MNIQAQLAELNRRIDNLLRVGTVDEVKAGFCRVKTGGILTDWRPWFTHRAGSARTSWRPTKGEQVMLMSPSGDLACAYVLPALYQDAMPEPDDHPTRDRTLYPDGTRVEYDPEAHKLTADLGPTVMIMDRTKISLSTNGSTLVMDASGIRLNGARIDLN